MFERFTEESRRVVVLSQEHAKMLNHGTIETRHLLLALLHDGPLVELLEEIGVDTHDLAERTRANLGVGPRRMVGHIPFTPRSREVIIGAQRAAFQVGCLAVEPLHVLMALLDLSEDCANLAGGTVQAIVNGSAQVTAGPRA